VEIARRAPGLDDDELTTLARLAAGRLDRATRLLDPAAAKGRAALLDVARSAYRDPDFEPPDAAGRLMEAVRARGAAAREQAQEELEGLDLTAREAEQRVRRAQRGAEREELLATLEELAAWYRDLLVVGSGAEGAAVHSDRLAELREDATRERLPGAERACEAVRATWRNVEELNVSPGLALEALLVEVRQALAGTTALV
jgi:DNA polymerase-3 subunit delta'